MYTDIVTSFHCEEYLTKCKETTMNETELHNPVLYSEVPRIESQPGYPLY